MKTIFTLTFLLFTSIIFADSHIIVKQNGEKMEVKYVTTRNNKVFYSLSGSSTVNEISLYAVDKVIEAKTGSVIIDNNKADISGKYGYKNVMFVSNELTKGLNQGVSLKTTIHKFKGQPKFDWIANAKMRLKKQAAAQDLPFLVITKETDSNLEAIAYKY
jgi:hypothetical protein